VTMYVTMMTAVRSFPCLADNVDLCAHPQVFYFERVFCSAFLWRQCPPDTGKDNRNVMTALLYIVA
jgi:hypothetical protein